MFSKLRHVFAAVCFLFLIPLCVRAQVAIVVKPVQINYLQYESVFVRVAMRNLSAHPLAFGENLGLKGNLQFEIRRSDRNDPSFVRSPKDAALPDMTGVILPPGGEKSYMFNLSKHYDLRSTGRYSVKAVLRHPQLTTPYQSKEVHFNIVRGNLIWSRTVGLPTLDDDPDNGDKADADGVKEEKRPTIKTREYRILSYFTGKSNIYCLTLEDKDNLYMLRHIGYDLGPDLRPKCEIDFLSRLNVLLPASTKVYAYYQYNTDGNLENRQILMKDNKPPRLVYDPDTGIVKVVGGREARKDVDYEEIRDIQFLEDMRDPKSSLLDEPLDSDAILGPESVGAKEAADKAGERNGGKSLLEGF
ncbi:MAG: hypothetical protein IKQ16_03595 [Lentisphaeria bacterium]|nr:hypothetical protein [Lentisphaeria bacterium]